MHELLFITTVRSLNFCLLGGKIQFWALKVETGLNNVVFVWLAIPVLYSTGILMPIKCCAWKYSMDDMTQTSDYCTRRWDIPVCISGQNASLGQMYRIGGCLALYGPKSDNQRHCSNFCILKYSTVYAIILCILQSGPCRPAKKTHYRCRLRIRLSKTVVRTLL